MSNNILQWNPAKNNQESDASYSADSMRTGGAVPGIFAKELANKLFYQVTTVCSALGEMMSNKGYTISDADITVLITALANILTKADFGTTSGTVCQGNDSRFFASGTKLFFWQDTAPTGWTIDASAADAVLAVKGGSNAYNVVAGGVQAGTWTQPDHIHSYSFATGSPSGTIEARYPDGTASVTVASQNHTHSKSGNTAGTATPASYRPLANVGIIASKD